MANCTLDYRLGGGGLCGSRVARVRGALQHGHRCPQNVEVWVTDDHHASSTSPDTDPSWLLASCGLSFDEPRYDACVA